MNALEKFDSMTPEEIAALPPVPDPDVLDYEKDPTKISAFFSQEIDGWIEISVWIPVIKPFDCLCCPVFAKVENRRLVGWTTEIPPPFQKRWSNNPEIKTRIDPAPVAAAEAAPPPAQTEPPASSPPLS